MRVRSVAVVIVILAAMVTIQAQDAVFSSKVEAVRVDVLVTDRDKGGALAGLKPGDFEMLDNGVPQQVDLVSFEQIPLNVILALDMSDSVAGDRLDQLRERRRGAAGGAHEGRSGGAGHVQPSGAARARSSPAMSSRCARRLAPRTSAGDDVDRRRHLRRRSWSASPTPAAAC